MKTIANSKSREAKNGLDSSPSNQKISIYSSATESRVETKVTLKCVLCSLTVIDANKKKEKGISEKNSNFSKLSIPFTLAQMPLENTFLFPSYGLNSRLRFGYLALLDRQCRRKTIMNLKSCRKQQETTQLYFLI